MSGGGDWGQAFPAYIAVIAGLLFLAFVYLAVGQAAVLRNGAHTAAEAAALGATQDARDQLREGWLKVIDAPGLWQPFVRGEAYTENRACERAIELASLNKAEVDACEPMQFGFTVTVRTDESVGEAVVPGANERAVATASAVIEPLCTFKTQEPSRGTSSDQSAEPEPSSTPSEDPQEEDPGPISGLTCDGQPWDIDPEDPVLPEADALFRVRLIGDDE
ncbi:hypothetical protein [Streptomyces sp. NPDC057854]|uniref:hypothetical protein n=1 Tax=unclassified Streptomyces TaxID=2593676 RepID=UPI00368138FE